MLNGKLVVPTSSIKNYFLSDCLFYFQFRQFQKTGYFPFCFHRDNAKALFHEIRKASSFESIDDSQNRSRSFFSLLALRRASSCGVITRNSLAISSIMVFLSVCIPEKSDESFTEPVEPQMEHFICLEAGVENVTPANLQV